VLLSHIAYHRIYYHLHHQQLHLPSSSHAGKE
jgi:hypothetical protein